ncbi:MAG: lysophospholipid acyltransferase family protein [Clostridiaceae bacterium]|nr:lysophospholipid acyltransferase family protein [Clostridiaceae bacterium]
MAERQIRKPDRYQAPAGWLYWPLTVLAGMLLRLLFGLRLRRDPAVRQLSGPLIVLGNHASFLDPLIMAAALFPKRIHFLATRHFFRRRLPRAILELLRAIPKVQFRTDSRALKQMLLVLRSGGILGIYPEGQRSMTGSALPIDEAIAKLIHKANCPVVSVIEQGAYLAWPRWSLCGPRFGRVEARIQLLFTREETQRLDVDELQARVVKNLAFQDYAWQNTRRHLYLSRAPASGLHQICHQCPACGRTLAMTSSGRHIVCRYCGNRGLVDRFGLIRPARMSRRDLKRYQPSDKKKEGAVWPDPDFWQRWQMEQLYLMMRDSSFKQSFPVRLEILSDDGDITNRQSGVLSLDSSGLFFLPQPESGQTAAPAMRIPIQNKNGIDADYGRQFEIMVDNQICRFVFQEGQAVILMANAIHILFRRSS